MKTMQAVGVPMVVREHTGFGKISYIGSSIAHTVVYMMCHIVLHFQ